MSRWKQSKTVLMDKTNVKQSKKFKEKTWSRGTNSRLLFSVNATLNLSIVTGFTVAKSWRHKTTHFVNKHGYLVRRTK